MDSGLQEILYLTNAQQVVDTVAALDKQMAEREQDMATLTAAYAQDEVKIKELEGALATDETIISNLTESLGEMTQDRDEWRTKALSAPAPSPIVFTPAVYASLQRRTDWQRGADSAGLTGGITLTHNADGSTTFTVTPQPRTDGTYYNNFYNYITFESGVRNARANKYLQVTDFEISETDAGVVQQVETNFEHTLDHYQYNGGVSFLFGADKMRDPISGLLTSTVKGHIWRWYDITPGKAGWYELPDVPVDMSMFGVGKRVRIISEFVRCDDKMTHAAVTINGARYVINRTSTCKPQPTWGDHIQHGFQLDTRNQGTPFCVKLWDAECRVL